MTDYEAESTTARRDRGDPPVAAVLACYVLYAIAAVASLVSAGLPRPHEVWAAVRDALYGEGVEAVIAACGEAAIAEAGVEELPALATDPQGRAAAFFAAFTRDFKLLAASFPREGGALAVLVAGPAHFLARVEASLPESLARRRIA